MEEDDATSGGGDIAGGSSGGGLGDWPDDEEEAHEPRHNRGADRAGASSLAALTAPGGALKRRADAGAPLSLERAPSASVIGAAGGSAEPRRVDPLANLQEAMERNEREAREEREAAAQEKVAAAKTAQAQADAAAKEQEDAAAKAQKEEAARSRAPEPNGWAACGAAGRRRAEKVASAPRPLEIGAASSSSPNAEATSAAPPEWTPGGRTGVLNTAAQDVQAWFQAQGAALQQYMQAFLATRAAVRDYHNICAAAFNSHVQELAKRTTDLTERRRTAPELQQRLGEVQTELHTKEEERSKAAQECDRLAKELAERHKVELQKVKEREDSLTAGFETQHSNWVEKEKILTDGYGEIEDMIDEFFLVYSFAMIHAIEARCKRRSRVGVEIPPNAPRNLNEQLLAVRTRLQPAHLLLRRLQRAGAQVLTALWPNAQVSCTPSQTADWLEVAVGRFEACKSAAARAGARTALEFAKAWYPSLNLAQLATFPC
nr:uncharacterized protein LOC109738605 [Aegilops tauschii subsp. strangulata]